MEKLKIRHLVYQNYRPLMVQFKDGSRDMIQSIDFAEKIIGFLNRNNNYLLYSGNFKLLLRPLSDLTKPITVNGETFVPVEKLSEIFDLFFGNHNKRKKNQMTNIKTISDCPTHTLRIYLIANLSKWMVDELFEWHFDLFSLIDKGLAIAIEEKEEK